MRQIIADAVLALFTSIGIWAVLMLSLDRLISGVSKNPSVSVFFVNNHCEGLVYKVHWTLRHSRIKGVLLVDCGMNDEERRVAENLAAQDCRIWLITGNEFEKWMEKAELWMNLRN